MAEKKVINIEDAIASQTTRTFASEDKKAKKQVRKTTQVSLYFTDEEINFIDKVCQEEFLTRPVFIRKLLHQEMKKHK